MVPTLRDADLVLARNGAPVRRGDVVLARYRSMPGRLVLKRAVTPVDGGWVLRSDNVAAGGGSDVHGVADVRARVVLRLSGGRWWRPSRLRRAAG